MPAVAFGISIDRVNQHYVPHPIVDQTNESLGPVASEARSQIKPKQGKSRHDVLFHQIITQAGNWRRKWQLGNSNWKMAGIIRKGNASNIQNVQVRMHSSCPLRNIPAIGSFKQLPSTSMQMDPGTGINERKCGKRDEK